MQNLLHNEIVLESADDYAKKPGKNFIDFMEAMLRDIWHGTGLSKPVIERDNPNSANWRLIQWRPDGSTRELGSGSYN